MMRVRCLHLTRIIRCNLMEVRMLHSVRGTHGAFNAGQTADVADAVGALWVDAGVASPLESAAMEAPETAVNATPRPRKTRSAAATTDTDEAPGSDEPGA